MQCPYCKEEVLPGAIKCKHCGSVIGGVLVQTVSPSCNDFGALFTRALNIWKDQFVDLILLTLVFMLIVWIPFANIGFIAGYTRSLMKVARGEGKAQIGDLFNAWDCFANLLIYFILFLAAAFVLHFVPIIGPLAAAMLGFLVCPGMYAVIDGRHGAVDAFKWGIGSIQTNFVSWLLAYLVGSIVSCTGAILFGIGIILTAPLGNLITIYQYEQVK
jgi:hypothetical protein